MQFKTAVGSTRIFGPREMNRLDITAEWREVRRFEAPKFAAGYLHGLWRCGQVRSTYHYLGYERHLDERFWVIVSDVGDMINEFLNQAHPEWV